MSSLKQVAAWVLPMLLILSATPVIVQPSSALACSQTVGGGGGESAGSNAVAFTNDLRCWSPDAGVDTTPATDAADRAAEEQICPDGIYVGDEKEVDMPYCPIQSIDNELGDGGDFRADPSWCQPGGWQRWNVQAKVIEGEDVNGKAEMWCGGQLVVHCEIVQPEHFCEEKNGDSNAGGADCSFRLEAGIGDVWVELTCEDPVNPEWVIHKAYEYANGALVAVHELEV